MRIDTLGRAIRPQQLTSVSCRYLAQSLLANIGYCLPWAIALSFVDIDESSAWTYHALIFVSNTLREEEQSTEDFSVQGGSLVVTFMIILVVDTVWAIRLRRGKLFKATSTPTGGVREE